MKLIFFYAEYMWVAALLVVCIIILLQVCWVMMESWYGAEALDQEEINKYVADAQDIFDIYIENRN